MKITRLGTYKTGFKYYKNKSEITNNDEIEKIKLLKIPPAYENVTILNNKKIIAFGYDSKNRKQVLYNPAFIAKQNAKKYNKISASIKFFSKLKKKVAADLNGEAAEASDEKTMAIAVIITLILTCGFRIGNKKYEKDNNSVGLTTLKYKHLKFENNKISIDFIGKKGVRNVAECDNKIIYEYLHNKYKNITSSASSASSNSSVSGVSGDSKEEYIFSYDANTKVITSNDVNEYLKSISIKYSKSDPIIITTKDLRTWNANTLFLTYYKNIRKLRCRKMNKGDTQDAKKIDIDSEKIINKDIKAAIELVSEKLHNSYSICKKSYIDPKIIEDILRNIKQ
jgi:DNA topoisomerase-1